MNLTTFKLKKMNLTIGVRSRQKGSVRGTSLGFLGQNSMASSNIGSVRFGPVGSEYRVEKLDPRFQSGKNSRLRLVKVILTADLEST